MGVTGRAGRVAVVWWRPRGAMVWEEVGREPFVGGVCSPSVPGLVRAGDSVAVEVRPPLPARLDDFSGKHVWVGGRGWGP